MHVGNLLQHVEHAPDAVADAARQKQHEPRKRKAGDKRGKEPHDTPSKQQVDDRRIQRGLYTQKASKAMPTMASAHTPMQRKRPFEFASVIRQNGV